MNSNRIQQLCQRFKGKRIVVIGDVMLDHYINGDVRRISPEAPVPIVEFSSEKYLPGGAANVARNLATLGAKVQLLGAVGNDEHARTLKAALKADGMGDGGLLTVAGRPTTVKTRVLASHQQILRVDRESRESLPAAAKARLARTLKQACKGAAAIIVADYAKGVIDQETLNAVFAAGRKAGVPVCVDPKPSRPLKLKGAALLTPNRKELFELAGMTDQPVDGKPVDGKPVDGRRLQRAIARVKELYAPGLLLVTLGEAGMLLVEDGQPARHLPTAARAVYDVTGAGDTVIAAFVLAQAGGAAAVEAATFANLAAGVVVGKLGAATVTTRELADVTEKAES